MAKQRKPANKVVIVWLCELVHRPTAPTKQPGRWRVPHRTEESKGGERSHALLGPARTLREHGALAVCAVVWAGRVGDEAGAFIIRAGLDAAEGEARGALAVGFACAPAARSGSVWQSAVLA